MATPVQFTNRRGERLAGLLQGSPQDATVVSCHGMTSDKNGMKHRALADGLEKLGIACLRFDFAGCGDSAGQLFDTTYGGRMEDLEAAIAFVVGHGVTRVGLFGSSMGGAVALLVAARDERVKAIATLAAVGHPALIAERYPAEARAWQTQGYIDTGDGRIGRALVDEARTHDVVAAVGVLHSPLLVLHGEEDEVVPVSDAYDIASAARHVTLEVVHGADHRFTNPVHLRPAMARVAEFLAGHLAP